MRFKNAEEAFESLYDKILNEGSKLENTLYVQNIGFYIDDPINNHINTKWRNWKLSYAEKEWLWYLSQNRSVEELKKTAKIWDRMHCGDNIVNSNYGYQWNRNNQLDFVINELKNNPNSRRAVITIYDGKEHNLHKYDTPCTLSIVFNISDNKLNMSVLMRSNDLWFGFCNDQFCFSNLLKIISDKLNIKPGWYYHFCNNLHLYENYTKKNQP